MTRTLRSEGVLHQKLFKVDGELVEHYNRSLQATIGKTTALKEFYIDKRGDSIELEAELGKHFLQNGPSHRYMIVVSPDQSAAPLVHQEFSFDDKMIDLVYANFISGISVVTRVDSLFGEINDGIERLDSLEDILAVNNIDIKLQTPSGFIAKAEEQIDLVHKLKANPNLLIEDDSKAMKRIHELMTEIGDVREYNITDISVERQMGNFATRLFDGAYIFRDAGYPPKIELKRPNVNGEGRRTIKIRRYNPDSIRDTQEDNSEVEPEKQTVVIYHKNGHSFDNGPKTKFISFNQPELIVRFLTENKYAKYSEDLLDLRIKQVQELALVNAGVNIANMNEREIQQNVPRYKQDTPEMMALLHVKRKLAKGITFEDACKASEYDAQKLLLVPTNRSTNITNSLLSNLWPYDFQRAVENDQRGIEKLFERSTPEMQDYIVKVLKTQTE